MSDGEHFDAVVVGSGFGGSVMAYKLSKAGLKVCLLERGRRYPPGSFARSPLEMKSNFWDPSEGKLGLFQVWSFGDIDGLVSAGLGGGSLIYANVLIRKDASWFVRRFLDGISEPWPITREDLEPHYNEVETMLAPQLFPLNQNAHYETSKTNEFKKAAEAAGMRWHLPQLAVTFSSPPSAEPIPGEPIHDSDGQTTDNLHHRTRYTCRLCGECDIGCNFGSKNTLDYNYLTEAEKLGLVIRDHCEVKSLGPRDGGGYNVTYVDRRDIEQDPSKAESDFPTIDLATTKLVLSAGTFGSTYLLLKNLGNFPKLKDNNALGRYFSGNGDFLGVVHGATTTVNGRRTPRVLAPSKGPVITSTIREEDNGSDHPGYYLQDGGYPGFVDWLTEEIGNPLNPLERLLRFAKVRLLARWSRYSTPDIDEEITRLIGDSHRSSSVLPLLAMGMDTPEGVISLNKEDGRLALAWDSRKSEAYFDRAIEGMRTIAKELGGKLLEDPLWHLHRKVITVHPVGGCSMGHSPDDGVVDAFGQVFGYPDFVIADGSVMPGPVGPNPSFTIAALADRFADRLVAGA
jgi:cholesterol oxidase